MQMIIFFKETTVQMKHYFGRRNEQTEQNSLDDTLMVDVRHYTCPNHRM